MFGKLFSTAVLVSALIAGAVAKPVQLNRLSECLYYNNYVSEAEFILAARGDISFDNWHGMSSFDGFDNFYGSDNFIGTIHSQTIVEQDQELVCHTESIEIVQQRLLVIQELAKRCATNIQLMEDTFYL